MATKVTVVGWHMHPEAAVCEDCGAPASSFVTADSYAEFGFYEREFSLCRKCLEESGRYVIGRDRIEEVFRNLGL